VKLSGDPLERSVYSGRPFRRVSEVARAGFDGRSGIKAKTVLGRSGFRVALFIGRPI
jgi:hypothetical protein